MTCGFALQRQRLERMIEGVSAPSEPSAFGPQVALAEGPLGAAQLADRAMAAAFVARVRALVEFAAGRPASADRAQGEPGGMSPQRWVARPGLLQPVLGGGAEGGPVGFNLSRRRAEDWIAKALML